MIFNKTVEQKEPFFTYREETDDILIEVQPFYLKERSIPEQSHYFYAYRIKISNNSESSCRLVRRRWLIRNGKGTQREVEGVGVVGEQPTINKNSSFSYTSYCPLDTPTGNMRGHFLFEHEDGRKFSVTVPLFFFRPPENLLQ